MFSEYAIEAGCTLESKSDIEEIILATISHQMPKNIEEGTSKWYNAALFLDADLSVLAWDYPQPYLDYQWGIWKEYEFYGREGYCEGRSHVLNGMLTNMPTLYFHPVLKAQLEGRARANVRLEIDSLLGELHKIKGVA